MFTEPDSDGNICNVGLLPRQEIKSPVQHVYKHGMRDQQLHSSSLVKITFREVWKLHYNNHFKVDQVMNYNMQ